MLHLPSICAWEGTLLTSDCRLEAATSRLEDIAGSVEGGPAGGLNGSAREQEISSAAAQSQTTITPVPESKPAEPLPKQIEQFDELIDGDVAEFVQAADKVGGLAAEQVCERSQRNKVRTDLC